MLQFTDTEDSKEVTEYIAVIAKKSGKVYAQKDSSSNVIRTFHKNKTFQIELNSLRLRDCWLPINGGWILSNKLRKIKFDERILLYQRPRKLLKKWKIDFRKWKFIWKRVLIFQKYAYVGYDQLEIECILKKKFDTNLAAVLMSFLERESYLLKFERNADAERVDMLWRDESGIHTKTILETMIYHFTRKPDWPFSRWKVEDLQRDLISRILSQFGMQASVEESAILYDRLNRLSLFGFLDGSDINRETEQPDIALTRLDSWTFENG